MSLRNTFMKEVAAAALPGGGAAEGLAAAPAAPSTVVTPSDITALPPPAQRYLHFMGVVGRPRDRSFRLGARGRFRPRLDGGWRPVELWQYDTALPIARLYYMDIRMFGLPVRGRDIYLRGQGSLVIRPLDLFTVARYDGPEFDTGEMVTWLNDAVLIAPSFLLTPAVTWAPVDDDAFDVTVSDAGHSATARVFLDERGAPRDFSTDDRWFLDTSGGKKRMRRTRWTTPVAGWQERNGRRLPTGGQAVWHFDTGDVAYADFDFTGADLVFDPAAGS